LFTSIPKGLEAQSDRYRIDVLKTGSYESPTFKLKANDSCVGDIIQGLVTYTNPEGYQQTEHVRSFKIHYVCNLLTPKHITKENFDEKIELMEEKKLIIDGGLNITNLEERISRIVKECNFAMLQQLQESQQEESRKIDSHAQGLYDKLDIAL